LRQEDYEFKTSLGSIERPCLKQNKITSWVLVTHACNPSYSGGRDQEDRGSDPPSISRKKKSQKVLVEWLKMKTLSSNPSTTKTKKSK
jgi:hypothetical protein